MRYPEFTRGDRFRKAREQTGLDQEAFADELGISRGTVNNYEKDHVRKVQEITVRAWALRTGVDPEWLRRGVVPSSPPDGEGDALPKSHSPVAQLAEHPAVNRRISILPGGASLAS